MSGHGPAKRKIPIAYEKRKKTSMKKIFEEELLKHQQKKAAEKESNIRQEIKQTLSNIDALNEAIKFRKFVMLSQNNKAFRKQMGLYTLKEIEKLKKNPTAYKEAKAEAKKANEKWKNNDSAFMKKWETEAKIIERKFPAMKRKMNADIHGGKLDTIIEKLMKATGWQLITRDNAVKEGLPFNFGILKEVPPLFAQYREWKGINKWQDKANDEIILNRMKGKLEYYKEQKKKRKSSAERF